MLSQLSVIHSDKEKNNMYTDQDTAEDCRNIANNIMFKLMKAGDGFTKDDFRKAARSYQMYPDLIEEFSSSYFRMFEDAGYIQKTDESRVSEKNGLQIAVWVKTEE